MNLAKPTFGLILTGVVALAACNDDTGSATLSGTIGEETPKPVSVFLIDHPAEPQQKVLVMLDDPNVFCEVADSTGLAVVIGFPCGDPVVDNQTLAAPEDIECANVEQNWLLVEGLSGVSNEYLAVSGSVTIDSVGAPGEEITGSLTGDFGDEGSLTGTFEAIICP